MITETEKNTLTTDAKRLSKWFKIEVSISIFGHVILHWVYPPQNNE